MKERWVYEQFSAIDVGDTRLQERCVECHSKKSKEGIHCLRLKVGHLPAPASSLYGPGPFHLLHRTCVYTGAASKIKKLKRRLWQMSNFQVKAI